MSPMESDGVEDVVRGHGRLLVSAAGTAMTAAARALAQRNRAQREQELRALAEAQARAETDRRLMLLRLEMAKSPSWRKEATLADAAETLYVARLYAPVEPTAAAAVPTLEEHMRTRWEREPDDVLAERAQQVQRAREQSREQAREAEAVWGAVRAYQPEVNPLTPERDHAMAHLFVPQPASEIQPEPLQAAAGSWELILREPDRWWGVDAYGRAWQGAAPFVEEHPGPARAVVLAEEKLRQVYPEKLAEFDALRERSGARDAVAQIAPQLRYFVQGEQESEAYAVMLAPDEGRAVTAGTAAVAWAAARMLGGGWVGDEDLALAESRAQQRLREVAPQVMERYDQMIFALGPEPGHADKLWAVDMTVAEVRAMVADEPAQERAGSAGPVAAERSQERAGTARADGPARASSPASTTRRPAARESMHAHPAGVSTEQTSTPGPAKDQGLAERLLQQQRRRAERARTERADRDGDRRSR